MRKAICMLLVCVLSFVMLAACGRKEKENTSSISSTESVPGLMPDDPVSQSQVAGSSAIPEAAIDPNPFPGQTAIAGKNLELRMFSKDGSDPSVITLTLRQQNYIQKELQAVLDRYADGTYPLAAAADGEAACFDTGWPSGVGYPATMPLDQMIFSTVGQHAHPLRVQAALTMGWYMECALAVDADEGASIDYASEGNTWIPADACFIDPNGLAHDGPGDPAGDDTVIVIS